MDNNKQTYGELILKDAKGKGIYAKTKGQQYLVEAIDDNDITFVSGPAGAGKTFIAVAKAVQYLQEKRFDKIILTRPAVESGENLGFLPGTIDEKIDPYMKPVYDFLNTFLKGSKKSNSQQKEHFQNIEKKGSRKAKKDRTAPESTKTESSFNILDCVEVCPLAYMRGKTLDNAFVLLDEAQNVTRHQMKMFLTRMGQNSKFVITGDESQSDLNLRRNDVSGFEDALDRLYGIEGIGHCQMTEDDIVRHKIIKDIIRAYDLGRVE